MIEEQAVVIDREGDYIWVHTNRQSTCGHCSVSKGCGTQMLSKVLGNKTAYVRCFNSKDARIGDRVVIGITESALLSGSFLVYFLPLLGMILAGALAGQVSQLWWPQGMEPVTIIASICGLLLGLVFSSYHTQKSSQRKRYEPVLLKKLGTDSRLNKPVIWHQ